MIDDTDPPVNALLDALLPGGGDWPPAGDVIRSEVLPHAVHQLAREVAGLSQDERIAAIAAFEANQPADFADLYHAVTDAYYATPEAAQVLQKRAAAGPPDTSGPPFDRTLLDGVVTERRGRRRL